MASIFSNKDFGFDCRPLDSDDKLEQIPMNMHDYQSLFNKQFFPIDMENMPSPEAAFQFFQNTLHEGMDDVWGDEFTFIISQSSGMFSIVFGRNPHAKERRGFSVGDISCHFYYELNENLRAVIEKNGNIEINCGFNSPESIKQAIDEYKIRTDEVRFIWDLVRDLKPIEIDLYCYLF